MRSNKLGIRPGACAKGQASSSFRGFSRLPPPLFGQSVGREGEPEAAKSASTLARRQDPRRPLFSRWAASRLLRYHSRGRALARQRVLLIRQMHRGWRRGSGLVREALTGRPRRLPSSRVPSSRAPPRGVVGGIAAAGFLRGRGCRLRSCVSRHLRCVGALRRVQREHSLQNRHVAERAGFGPRTPGS